MSKWVIRSRKLMVNPLSTENMNMTVPSCVSGRELPVAEVMLQQAKVGTDLSLSSYNAKSLTDLTATGDTSKVIAETGIKHSTLPVFQNVVMSYDHRLSLISVRFFMRVCFGLEGKEECLLSVTHFFISSLLFLT